MSVYEKTKKGLEEAIAYERGELSVHAVKIKPLSKLSKKEQRKYFAAKRGSWNGISPVTRVAPNGKGYDRNRIKREACGAGE